MRPSIRATGRVMQRWMGQAARQQAKMISAHMVLTPVLVRTLNTGTTCVARRDFVRGDPGAGRGRDSLLATREPNPKSPPSRNSRGEGVSRRRVDSSPMVTFHVEHRTKRLLFRPPGTSIRSHPVGFNLPISCRNPRFRPTICYQMRPEPRNGPAQA